MKSFRLQNLQALQVVLFVLCIDYFIQTEMLFLMFLLSILFFQQKKILKEYVRYILQIKINCFSPIMDLQHLNLIITEGY